MDYRQCEWRVGRSVGRTIYAIIGPDRDVLIGVLDSKFLAEAAVYAHNILHRVRQATAKRLTAEEEQDRVAKLHLSLQASAEGAAVATEST